MSDVARRRLITISIPVYNEAGNIARLLERLDAVAAAETAYDFEFLFTDNASEDETYRLLADAARRDRRVRVVRFSRNFGFQRSILTNFLLARGDAAVQIDADLQDPPELIRRFLELWAQGYRVVYGVRRGRAESVVLSGLRKLYYRVVRSLSEVELPNDAGDFRLIDRSIIEHLRTVSDKNPYLRGLIAALGHRQIGVEYDRDERRAGKSKFNAGRLVRLGIDGIVSQSTAPLRYITIFGFLLSALTGLVAVLYLAYWAFTWRTIPPGFTTLVLLQLVTIGLNAALMGVLGEYLARVAENVRGHPFVVIESTIESGEERVAERVYAGTRENS
ncbi:MAG: glycosyltransferase family 2 protein [Alphaproteobacteria bacterium]|nr:glycosyltransferase family 2 protein [Alphaproteobacteria bacterium]